MSTQRRNQQEMDRYEPADNRARGNSERERGNHDSEGRGYRASNGRNEPMEWSSSESNRPGFRQEQERGQEGQYGSRGGNGRNDEERGGNRPRYMGGQERFDEFDRGRGERDDSDRMSGDRESRSLESPGHPQGQRNGWERGSEQFGMGMRQSERGSQDGSSMGASNTYGASWADGNPGQFQPGQSRMSGPHAGKGPRGYKRSDDLLKEDVCQRLAQNPQLDASNVEVEVKDGLVTLTGSVDDRQAKRMAEDLVEAIFGVKDVHNQIRVMSTAAGKSTSEQPESAEAGQGTENRARQAGERKGASETERPKH